MTKDHDFVKGVTMGVVTGAALGMVMAPRKKTSMKKAAGKAMKTMGQVMENFSDEMGFKKRERRPKGASVLFFCRFSQERTGGRAVDNNGQKC